MKPADRVDHLIERRVDEARVIAHGGHAHRRLLPVVEIGHFRNRNIELILNPVADLADRLALIFERVAAGDEKFETKSSENHDGWSLRQSLGKIKRQ